MASSRFLVALALLVSACASNPISNSVQRGGSVLIPMGNEAGLAQLHQAGLYPKLTYGSDTNLGDERGVLEFYLDDPSVPANILETRIVAAASPHPASELARSTTTTWSQVNALIDVPTSAPLGPHTLYVRRMVGGVQDGPTGNLGTLQVLPASLTFSDGANTHTVVGAPSSHQNDNRLHEAAPAPTLIFDLGASVHAAELLVAVPSGAITVLDSFDPRTFTPNGRALVWHGVVAPPNAPQTIGIKAVARATSQPFDSLALVFESQGAPLDPSTVFWFVTRATDELGNDVTLPSPLPTPTIR